MKKIIASAVGLMLAGGIAATSASAALENQFGGYWRTRFTYMDNFSGTDTSSKEFVDTRTHLYYTAKFSDDFKFVNKFEFNTGWGDTSKTQTVTIDGTSYNVTSSGLGAGGDLGADGKGNFRIKNSYADFNIGPMFNAKVGIQNFVVARGFIWADDEAGVMVTGKFGNVTVPLVWINVSNDETYGFDQAVASDFNQNVWAALAAVKINDGMSVTPYFVYHSITDNAAILDSDNWYLGADVDLKFGSVGVWGTAIYNGGDINGLDNKGYLGAVGVDAGIVHGQFFYASGDDDATDGDNAQFISAPGNSAGLKSGNVGSSYYWAEIMGFGVFDNYVSNGAPADDITNIWAGNVGVTVKPIDKLKVDVDVWYASLAEDNAAGDAALGLEFDGKIGYNLYDNLTAEAIFAYLVSDDATGDEDVMEGGVRLSLKF
ncbi:MAG: hypothetical protein OEL83_18295 [Desulforhopalus sp.]|nr:hypothetical protein [Desulforhopalus sp.]